MQERRSRRGSRGLPAKNAERAAPGRAVPPRRLAALGSLPRGAIFELNGKRYQHDGLAQGGVAAVELVTVSIDIGGGATRPHTYGIARYVLSADTEVKAV